MFCFTCSERKIWQIIKRFKNALTMIAIPTASSAHQTCFTSRAIIQRRFYIYTVAKAKKNIAKLSPWVLPSVDCIFAPPSIITLKDYDKDYKGFIRILYYKDFTK